MGLNLEKNQEVIVETRSEKKKLKKWVRVTIGTFITIGIIYSALNLGYYIIGGLLTGDPIASDENETLVRAGEMRAEEKTFSLNMDEDKALMVLNQMTHQKIQASEKHGAVEMNENNINEMIQVVEESNYDHKSEMLRILKKWKRGDFTYIVQDHNEILDLQDGEIGKAFGTMSAEEEQEFIERVFRD